MTMELGQITDIPFEEREAKFREVIKANAEKVGGENGSDLTQLGELVVEYLTLEPDDREKLDKEKLLPLYGKLLQASEGNLSVAEAIESVNWWHEALFSFSPIR